MATDTKPILMPKLRFPEFRNDPGWAEEPMSEVYSLKGSNSLPREKLNYGGGTIRNIHYGDIHTKFATLFDISKETVPYINSSESIDDFHSDEDCAEGDMVFADASEDLEDIGKSIELIRLNGERVVSGLHTILARPTEGYLVLGFGAHLFKCRRVRAQIQKEAQGAKVLGISAARLAKINLPLPPTKAEQSKIAECLSTLDALIGAESQKLDALKVHKKGLTQELFPGEGETAPRLRFANDCHWTVARLPDVAFFQEGPGIMAVDFRNEGVPLVRLAGLGGSEVTLDGCNYLDPEKVAQKWAHFRLAIDDLVISTSATFGLSSIVTEAAAGAVFYTGLIRFRPSDEQVDRGYLQAFLGSPYFARQAESAAVGGGIKHFGPTHLQQMQIPIPPRPEQQRIASCLSSLDVLIAAQRDKLEALKMHKKGLMQQLFPPPAEAQV